MCRTCSNFDMYMKGQSYGHNIQVDMQYLGHVKWKLWLFNITFISFYHRNDLNYIFNDATQTKQFSIVVFDSILVPHSEFETTAGQRSQEDILKSHLAPHITHKHTHSIPQL